jgi:hypothetical protein
MKIPCDNCICFPVCQHTLKDIIQYKATGFYIVSLCRKCNLFGEWWSTHDSFQILPSIRGLLNENSM